ncbi:hypothetical protein E4U58_001447 [Claviceps cyperi]|nr:hypothetical protein E4U58_001447 [Claviceps cyperi]
MLLPIIPEVQSLKREAAIRKRDSRLAVLLQQDEESQLFYTSHESLIDACDGNRKSASDLFCMKIKLPRIARRKYANPKPLTYPPTKSQTFRQRLEKLHYAIPFMFEQDKELSRHKMTNASTIDP